MNTTGETTMNKLTTIISILLLSVALGCATVGHKIDFNQLQHLRVGQSPVEVVDIYGQPTQVTTLSTGEMVLVWVYVDYNSFTGTKTQKLQLVFKDRKLVAVPEIPTVAK
jgi:hypothetical protein